MEIPDISKIFTGAGFPAIIDAAPIPMYLKDNSLKYIYCNKHFEIFFAVDKEHFINKTVYNLVSFECANIFWANDTELLSDQQNLVLESVLFDSHFIRRDVTIYKSVIKDAKGVSIGIIGAIIDNNGKKLAEQAMLSCVVQYSRLLETGNDAIWLLSADGKITFANKKFSDISGYNPDEIINQSIRSFIDMDTETNAAEIFLNHPFSSPEKINIQLKNKNGKTISGVLSISSISNSSETFLGSLCVFTESAELQKKNNEVKIISDLLKAVIDSFPDIVIILDLNNNVLYLNKAGCDYYHLDNDDFEGKKCHEIFDKARYFPRCRRNEAIEKKEPVGMEFHNPETDTWMDIRYYPVFGFDGTIAKIIDHRRDITHQKQTERMLIESLKTEKEMNMIKAEFISNFSHETRTPLNGIMGYAQLLLADETLSVEHREFAGNILKSGERLLTLLDNILDISQIEQGNFKIHYSFFNVNKIIDDILFLNQFRIVERDIEILVELNGNNEIYSDARRIHIILINLIGNAIKFIKQGKILISLQKNDNEFLFSIEDTGIGMSSEMTPKIFQDFTKGESGFVREYEGIGLGLSICKKMVTLLGGKIWFKTELNKGSIFSFSIPDTSSEIQRTGQDLFEIKSIPVQSDSVKVVVIDDDIMSLYYYKNILETRKNFIFKLYNSPTDFLDDIEFIIDYHIIILDIRMAKMGGFELLKRIKQKAPQIPVIAITAFAETNEKKHYYEAGFSEMLIKPITVENLLLNIDKLVSK